MCGVCVCVCVCVGVTCVCGPAVGCASVTAPVNAWSRVTGQRAVVQCNHVLPSWRPWWYDDPGGRPVTMSSDHNVGVCYGLLWCDGVVQCNSSSEAWFLTCRGTTWVGHVGNCSDLSVAYHTGLRLLIVHQFIFLYHQLKSTFHYYAAPQSMRPCYALHYVRVSVM